MNKSAAVFLTIGLAVGEGIAYVIMPPIPCGVATFVATSTGVHIVMSSQLVPPFCLGRGENRNGS